MPSSYTALRTRHTTYVEYADGDREFYDRRRDPGELHNRARRLTRARRAGLSAALARYRRCRGTRELLGRGASDLTEPAAGPTDDDGAVGGGVGGIQDGSGPSAAGTRGAAGRATVRPFLGDARLRSTR